MFGTRDHTTVRKYRGGRYLLFLPLILAGVLFGLPAAGANQFEEAVKLGKAAAEQVEKESTVVTDPEVVERIEKIGKALSAVAKQTEVQATYGKPDLADFAYSFKAIEDNDINAFALPGGFVYVNTGLIESVHSDDELAGVIAHEIAHVAHHHSMQLLKTQQKELTTMALAMIVGAAVGANTADMGNLAMALNLVRIAKLSAYGQEAEFDADRTAVVYMSRSGFNPVGMLTFMERLASDAMRKPQRDAGIFATHPPSHKRAKQIVGEIERLGLPINRRLVTSYLRVQVRPIEDPPCSAVYLGDEEIIRLADAHGERSAVRAEKVAERLSNAVLADARMHDVKIGGGNQFVTIMGKVLVAPNEVDAELAGMTIEELVSSSANAIRKALLKELLDQKY